MSFIATFSRAQIASFIATLVDYCVVFSLTEIFRFWYVPATALGAGAGGVTNFIVNRKWTFQITDKNWKQQAMRYTLVSLGSLFLNTIGVYLITETTGTHYAVSVILVSLCVAWFFNFPLQRYFVYRP